MCFLIGGNGYMPGIPGLDSVCVKFACSPSTSSMHSFQVRKWIAVPFKIGLAYNKMASLYCDWRFFSDLRCILNFELLWLLCALLYVRSGVRVKSCVRGPPLNPRVKHRRCFSVVGWCSVSSVQVIWNWCMWFFNVCPCALVHVGQDLSNLAKADYFF